jgi:UTP--glucose-1-phosphate uridylyltransferase
MKSQSFYAFEFDGRSYDCGDKIGYLQATAAFAMANAEYRTDAIATLQGELKRGGA